MIIFFATLAVVSLAAFSLFSRHVLKNVSAHAFSLLINIFGTILFLPIALADLSYSDTRAAWFAVVMASAIWAIYSLVSSISTKKN